jgi:hypothetical protein
MPRVCTVCTHANRDRIDAALVQPVAKRRIAADFGVAESSLRRHADAHLPALLARAADSAEVVRANDLLGTARRIQVETLAVLETAKAEGNLGGVLAAVDRAQRGIALLGGLLERVGGAKNEPQRVEFCWKGEG